MTKPVDYESVDIEEVSDNWRPHDEEEQLHLEEDFPKKSWKKSFFGGNILFIGFLVIFGTVAIMSMTHKAAQHSDKSNIIVEPHKENLKTKENEGADTAFIGVDIGASPIKSKLDKKDYKMISLGNKLDVMVISDNTTDKSAAALDVNVGHLSDPEDIPGLAHFNEHMLFLGTKKWPKSDDYQMFLSDHDGSSNAFTAFEHTNYYFDIAADKLEPALERFAQFFISPLFTEEFAYKEMKAVDSEHKKNLLSDSWKTLQLLKTSSDGSHPFHKFGTGDISTLQKPKIHDRLLEFYNKHYSANVMKLCILGKEPVHVLEEWARKFFSEVENKALERPKYQGTAFHQDNLGKLYLIQPSGHTHSLTIYWPMEATLRKYRNGAEFFVSHLLGFESEGSLTQVLRKKGWADKLSTGMLMEISDMSIFICKMELTSLGLKKMEDVISLVYQAITLTKNNKAEYKRIWDELIKMTQAQFDYTEPKHSSGVTSDIAEKMHSHAVEDVLRAPSRYQFDPEAIDKFLCSLTPQNSVVHALSPSFNTSTLTGTEKWYGTHFEVMSLGTEKMNKWSNAPVDADLKMQGSNIFIPTDFAVKKPNVMDPPGSSLSPAVVSNKKKDSKAKVYYLKDEMFHVPKAMVFIDFLTPKAYDSVKSGILTSFFVSMLDDSLRTIKYDAEFAGLNFKFSFSEKGLTLHAEGFNQPLPVLMKTLSEHLKTFNGTEANFALAKEKIQRSYLNFKLGQPYEIASYYSTVFLQKRHFLISQFEKEFPHVTLSEVHAHKRELLQRMMVLSYVHGNVHEQETLDLIGILEKTVEFQPLPVTEVPQLQILNIPANTEYLITNEGVKQNQNSAVVNYYQAEFVPGQLENKTLHRDVLVDFIGTMMFEPAFAYLRTKESLGYIVNAGVDRSAHVSGVHVLVQSNQNSTHECDVAIEAFLKQYYGQLKNLTQEEFVTHKKSLLSKYEEKDQQLAETASRLWHEISTGQENFHRLEKKAAQAKVLTKEDLVNMYEEMFVTKRRKISSQVYNPTKPPPPPAANYVVVKDVMEAKTKAQFYPGTY